MDKEKVLQLQRSANALKTFLSNWADYVRDDRCDKKNWGFNIDSRFSSFSVKVSFDNYHGYYGNSGCSTFLQVLDSEILQRAFLETINSMKFDIIKTMIKLIENTADTERDRIIKELNEEIKILQKGDKNEQV